MDISLIVSIFLTLFIAVDPFGLIPIFVIFIARYNSAERKKIIYKAILTALCVSIFFIFFGRFVLSYLGIYPGSFLISGGILLLLVSIDLIFSRSSHTSPLYENAANKDDISVFPLAIPLISGPGTIAALMMFSSQITGNQIMLVIIALIVFLVLLITMIVMFMSAQIEKILGKTGISVIQRIMGLILSALAVQFIINGLRQIGII